MSDTNNTKAKELAALLERSGLASDLDAAAKRTDLHRRGECAVDHPMGVSSTTVYEADSKTTRVVHPSRVVDVWQVRGVMLLLVVLFFNIALHHNELGKAHHAAANLPLDKKASRDEWVELIHAHKTASSVHVIMLSVAYLYALGYGGAAGLSWYFGTEKMPTSRVLFVTSAVMMLSIIFTHHF